MIKSVSVQKLLTVSGFMSRMSSAADIASFCYQIAQSIIKRIKTAFNLGKTRTYL